MPLKKIVKKKTTTKTKPKPKPKRKVVKKVVKKTSKKSCPRDMYLQEDGQCVGRLPCFDDQGNVIPYMERDKYGNCRIKECAKGKILDPETMTCISVKTPRGKALTLAKKFDDAKMYVQRYNAVLNSNPAMKNNYPSYEALFRERYDLDENKRQARMHEDRIMALREAEERRLKRLTVDPTILRAIQNPYSNPLRSSTFVPNRI